MPHAPIKPQDRAIAHMIVEQRESDRGCIIFGSAMIEDQLETLLRSCFRKDAAAAKIVDSLFAGYAPLSTLSAKIQVVYALGLISDKIYKQLLLLKKIRNNFAHDKEAVSFDSPRYQRGVQAFRASFRSEDPAEDIEAWVQQLKEVEEDDNIVNRFAMCMCISGLIARLRVAEEFAPAHLALLMNNKDWRLERCVPWTECNESATTSPKKL